MDIKRQITALILTVTFLNVAGVFVGDLGQTNVAQAEVTSGEPEVADDDYEKYLKYDKYLKWYKREKYRSYKKAKKKYGFDSSEEKFAAKACYRQIRDLRKAGTPKEVLKVANPCYEGYKEYKRYKENYSPKKKYKKYAKYDKDEYGHDSWERYNASANRAGYERWRGTHRREADLGGGTLGPTISVGLHALTEDQLEDDSFRITAFEAGSDEQLPYRIKDKNGNIVANVDAGQETRVKYVGERSYLIYNFDGSTEENSTTTVSQKVSFEYQNSADANDIYFDIYHSEFSSQLSTYDEYRDKIQLSHYDPSGGSNDRIWVINFLPLEHYVWGMGEITGTGDMDYNRVMTISYRTYGYWKLKYSTAYAARGFKVNATPGNQLYYGYDYEVAYDRIREAAEDTRGKIVMYGHRIAITPYSSWTDGRTRSFEERWGSSNYPWCQSVRDPYGKHPSKSTSQLVSEGNHMVGLSAHGALDRAEAGWDYGRIIEYYYTDVDIYGAY